MVLEAFVGPRPAGFVANHKDGNRLNNVPDNLEWVTQKENVHHAMRNGWHKAPVPRRKLNIDQVKQIRARWPHESQRHLANEFGVCQATIRDIVHHAYWRTFVGESA